MENLKVDGRFPEPLFQVLEDLKGLGRDAFAARYGPGFLLFNVADVRGREDMKATTLEPRPEGVVSDDTTAPTTFSVYAIYSDPDAERVSVGRVSQADIVVADQSVSSTHAYFLRSSTGALSLVDAGSKNGTFVDEVLVPATGRGEPTPLGHRHAVRFGSVSLVYLDLDALADAAALLGG